MSTLYTTSSPGVGGPGNNNPPDRSTAQFPWRLHELLTEAESNGNSNIISWIPGTNAFKVHNKLRFTSEILPSYFNATKYKSFQRNLNLWGFESIQEGPNKGGCFHPRFIRGDVEQCHYMSRQKVKGNQARTSMDVPLGRPIPTANGNVARAPLSALADLASQATTSNNFAPVTMKAAEPTPQPSFYRSDDLKMLPLPKKLHHILARPNFAECICWTPDGRCVRVVDPFKFQEMVAPLYFSHTSFSSFLVELESYGFKKVQHAGFQECYYHDLMIRGCVHLCKYMSDPESSRRYTAGDPMEDLRHDPAFGSRKSQSSSPLNHPGANSLLSSNQLLTPDSNAAGAALVQEFQQRQQLAAIQLIAGGATTAPPAALGALGIGSLGAPFYGPGAMAAATAGRRASMPGGIGLGGPNGNGQAPNASNQATENSSTKTPIANLLANTSSQGAAVVSGRSEAV
eukprot:Nitzschia sp. Nitz4//scaffold211_size37880//9614//11244//NITZ4_007701-RA/size37880-augustus-gene-0.59-mRNA-1//-1//CDS//3329541964//228//frame0